MIKIDRWVDINSKEFELLENTKSIKKFIVFSVKVGAVIPDNNGRLFVGGNKNMPLHDNFNSNIIGYRISTMAAN